MRIHCLGVGSIGSLLATSFAATRSPPTIRLIVRRKDLLAHLVARPTPADSTSHRSSSASASDTQPRVALTIERDGIPHRYAAFEIEHTLTPTDQLQIDPLSAHVVPSISSSKYPSTGGGLSRKDPISTLIVTTKAPQALKAIKHLLPRLSSSSTIVLCHNGMGVLENLLEQYWPDDDDDDGPYSSYGHRRARPSFICATTSHGVWRRSADHFVHAGVGHLQFGVVPNRSTLSSIQSHWPDEPSSNPLLNPRALIAPTLQHLPTSSSLHATLDLLLRTTNLNPLWLPLPQLQIAQLQKLAVNCAVNSLTAIVGVHNGALVGSRAAKDMCREVASECSSVFAAHVMGPTEDGEEEQASALSDPASASYDDSTPTTIHPRPARTFAHNHALSEHSLLQAMMKVIFATSTNISSTLADLEAIEPIQDLARIDPRPLPTGEKAGPARLRGKFATRTEMDYINGYVSALGRKYHIPTPLIDGLATTVKLKEEMIVHGAVERLRTQAEEKKALFLKEKTRLASSADQGIPKKTKGRRRLEKVLALRQTHMQVERERERDKILDRQGGSGGDYR
ncbi:BZ3500_MvSof-1268-A1-R1_Chr7-1g09374 [Microbotryum saponariae]|uniref:BZ3500_MvSof-1268-A1-R1_Chr7-1g09374 protein n=1 Tax=Microbotryum saponariae TaxID=289078 RepID=A0A2X0LEJ8_9BASI|nr:BZ3501_MvSof-1269-A2-R1_Chr7-1g09079 [Microbotryum saponariae]SDA03318.1 BZ3500_MvSof-1268-A1-R1_Chr7-1g09374 [Microbotryum saponariae]